MRRRTSPGSQRRSHALRVASSAPVYNFIGSSGCVAHPTAQHSSSWACQARSTRTPSGATVHTCTSPAVLPSAICGGPRSMPQPTKSTRLTAAMRSSALTTTSISSTSEPRRQITVCKYLRFSRCHLYDIIMTHFRMIASYVMMPFYTCHL